ncbi:MAG: hypothetical protein M3070_14010 [Actinomycetota bacterium]|nr:hypothetical protein [Actinomycetota bacterium]
MSRAKSALGLAIAVGGGAIGVALVGLILHGSGPNASALEATVRGTAHTSQGTLTHAFLKLASYPDSMAGEHGKDGGAHPDWVSYGPSTNLHVPAHALVTVTIDQYDGGEKITNPYFAKVHGTVGNTMTVNGKVRTQTNPDTIGHTFTIHGAPTNQYPLFVSVPLPAVPDDVPVAKGSDYPKPNVVTFSFMTHGKGHYVWNCEYPCGDGYYAKFGGPMSTRGYMSGTVTVG